MAEKFTPDVFAAWVRRWSSTEAIQVDAAQPEPPTVSERDIPTMVLPAPQPAGPEPKTATQSDEFARAPSASAGATARKYPEAKGIVKGKLEWELLIKRPAK